MAQVIPLQSSMPVLQQAAQRIADKYGGMRADETNWMVKCPIHDDQQASCHIHVTDRLLAFCHVCGKEKQKDLVAKIKEDGLWPSGIDNSSSKPPSDKSNIPAHAVPSQFPKYLSGEGGNYPVSKIWTYHTATGHPAFWILRADPPTGQKIVKPFSSFTINNEDVFKIGLQSDNRPLYNLPEIVNNPNKPILIVEGEKAADAATRLFPSHIATTWSGGKNGLRNTNISVLLNRAVVLWPDNDLPGIGAMLAAALVLPDALIVFQEVQDKLPAKWDVADPSAFTDGELLEFINNAKPPIQPKPETKTTLEYLKDKWQKVEDGTGGTGYYDVTSRSHDRRPEQPFKMYSSKQKLQEAEPHMEIADINGEPKRVRVIDKYIDDHTQPHAVGLTFDPTTKNVRVTKGSALYLNTFMGIENPPVECDQSLYQPFIDHLNGIFDKESAEYMMNWISDMFQNIARKPGVMPIIKGKPGSGKSIIGVVISAMLGNRIACCIPCGAIFDSSFNGMLSRKIFISLDEINLYGASNKNANETLKTMITDKDLSINKKYSNQAAEISYHRYMGTTNIDYAVHIDTNDRRYAMFTASDTFIGNDEHFDHIGDMLTNHIALSGLSYYFKSRQITAGIRKIPQTEARTLIQKPEDPILAMIHSWLDGAVLPQEIRSQLIHNEWPEKSVLIPRNIINDHITKKHPSLSGTRPTNKLLEHFTWSRSDGREHNTVRIEVYDVVTKVVNKENARVYELQPIEKQRRIYEEVTNTKPKWSEIVFSIDEPKDNVVPIKDVF